MEALPAVMDLRMTSNVIRALRRLAPRYGPGNTQATKTAAEHLGSDATVLLAIPRLTYRLYERHLLKQVQNGRMPRHVGIILDGNRRHGVDFA
jgi:hypothetical protein